MQQTNVPDAGKNCEMESFFTTTASSTLERLFFSEASCYHMLSQSSSSNAANAVTSN